MPQLLVLVLDREEQFPEVLQAWREAGAPGVTVLQSTGPGRLQNTFRDDLPLMPTLRDLLESQELHHRTLFTVVADDLVEKVVAATHEVVGSFTQPHTGLLFTVPVGQVWGLQKTRRS